MNDRNYGIDFMRIVAMYFIVILHVVPKELLNCSSFSLNGEIAWLFNCISSCAVNCYGIISGYVGYKSKYRYSNIIMLWLRVVFYTLGITLVFFVLFPQLVSAKTVIKAFFPVITHQYWYFVAYVCLFLFIPLINKSFESLSKTQAKSIIIVLICTFSIFQTCFGEKFGTSGGYSGLWLIILYIVGSYIGKYRPFEKTSVFICGITYIICIMISWGTQCSLLFLSFRINGLANLSDVLKNNCGRLSQYTSPTTLFASIALILLLTKINYGEVSKKVIRFMSPMTFSVYLIHVNPLIWNNFLYKGISLLKDATPIILIMGIIVGSVSTYLICSCVDLLRIFIFNKLNISNRLAAVEKRYIKDIWN